MQRAVQAIKRELPDLLVICDVCLDEYTSHGHCGLIRNGEVDNDSTRPLLAKTAVTQVEAGADIVAPSDMMDGRVGRIRQELDACGFTQTPILAYSAKYASAFYGPFREAADSAPKFGDRKAYQMDPANQRESMREIELDLEEGADIIMVKPALPYLDVIALARRKFDVPIAAYQVSGELSLIEAAARAGWIDRDRMIMETLRADWATGDRQHDRLGVGGIGGLDQAGGARHEGGRHAGRRADTAQLRGRELAPRCRHDLEPAAVREQQDDTLAGEGVSDDRDHERQQVWERTVLDEQLGKLQQALCVRLATAGIVLCDAEPTHHASDEEDDGDVDDEGEPVAHGTDPQGVIGRDEDEVVHGKAHHHRHDACPRPPDDDADDDGHDEDEGNRGVAQVAAEGEHEGGEEGDGGDGDGGAGNGSASRAGCDGVRARSRGTIGRCRTTPPRARVTSTDHMTIERRGRKPWRRSTPATSSRRAGSASISGLPPACGKTCAMLDEGWRRHNRGTDVVIGFVETHNRVFTAEMIRDLEIVPRRVVEYRGSRFEEMDTDAVIARHPQVALIDELAHTNIPGSGEHAKRWRTFSRFSRPASPSSRRSTSSTSSPSPGPSST